MDLDDIVKVLIPKSTRKKVKTRLKKRSLLGLLLDMFKAFVAFLSAEKGAVAKPKQGATPSAAASDPMQQAVAQAKTYQATIGAMARAAEPGSMRHGRLVQLNERVAIWVRTIEEIVMRTQRQNDDLLLAAERKQVPAAIKRLEKDLEKANDPRVRQKLVYTLENRRKQWEQLEQVENNHRLAALKVENTLAQLGIIYSQLHSGQYMAEQNSYERLSADIADEVQSLEDYLVTLDELQQDRGRWR